MSGFNGINRMDTYTLGDDTEPEVRTSESEGPLAWLSQLNQIKTDIALAHKDYEFFHIPEELLATGEYNCRLYCDKRGKCKHEACLEKTRERLREKLSENVREKFRELRAMSYGWGGTSESRRNRIESEIVLLDTRSEMNAIQCISIPFDEDIPAYYAISYRWGVHSEWKAETPNYVACITSISQGNLIKLCKYYRCRIRYIWIDVVCINQADKEHRKMAIKNMDHIYRRAKRVIAVPDLCYCDEYPLMVNATKENIEAVIIGMSKGCYVENSRNSGNSENSDYDNMKRLFDKNEPGTYRGFRLDVNELSHEMERWNEESWFRHLDQYTDTKEQLGYKGRGYDFLYWVIRDWAERAWVVSERIIGVDDKKLLIHILRANAIIYWGIYRWIDWDLHNEERTLLTTIFRSKSTKHIDRLFAILPHTKYKDAVQKLVDGEIAINDEEDLKWHLFDILDMCGRNDLLAYLISEFKEFVKVLPLPMKEEEFRFNEITLVDNDFADLNLFQVLGTTTRHKKRALKVILPFTLEHPQVSDRTGQLLDAVEGSEMKLIYQLYKHCGSCYYFECRKSKGVWVITGRDRLSKPPSMCKQGEFLMFW